jgi:hypothetical protein
MLGAERDLTAVSLVQTTFFSAASWSSLTSKSPNRDLQVLGLLLLGCHGLD